MCVGGWQQSQGSQVSTVQRLTRVLICKMMSLKPEQGDWLGRSFSSENAPPCRLCPALVSAFTVFPASFFFLCDFQPCSAPARWAKPCLQPSCYTVTERVRLEGTTEGYLVQSPCLSRVPQSTSVRIVSRRLLSVSREGASTASLGSLFLVILRVKKFFLMFFPSYCSAPPGCILFDTCPSDTCTHW